MDVDDVWRTIHAQRAELADLFEDLTAEEWEAASLCEAWRVRDVAAHLTLAQMGAIPAAKAVWRARGSFNRMIRDTAIAQAALPTVEYPALLRAMHGSRRTAPFVSELEPLIDVLVHSQDMCVPLGREWRAPPEATAVAATRVWKMGFPFYAQRRMRGLRLAATDHPWAEGSGLHVEGSMVALLLVMTGRSVGPSMLSGPGVASLTAKQKPRRSRSG